jgi:hypothetical protein
MHGFGINKINFHFSKSLKFYLYLFQENYNYDKTKNLQVFNN